jgi:hypothetical protein
MNILTIVRRQEGCETEVPREFDIVERKPRGEHVGVAGK